MHDIRVYNNTHGGLDNWIHSGAGIGQTQHTRLFYPINSAVRHDIFFSLSMLWILGERLRIMSVFLDFV